MKFNFETTLGIVVLFVFALLAVSLYSIFYFLIMKIHEEKKPLLTGIISLTILWVVVSLISFLISFSFGTGAYFLLSGLLIFAGSFLVSEKVFSLDGKHKIIYPLILSILINPAWLFVLGII